MAEKKIQLKDLILINRDGVTSKAEVRALPTNLPLEVVTSPEGGDAYYDQALNILYVYNDEHSKWEPQGVAFGPNQPPSAKSTPGALWFSTTDSKLKYYDYSTNTWPNVGASKLSELLDVEDGATDLQLLQYSDSDDEWKNVDIKDVLADAKLEDLGNVTGTASDHSFLSYQGDKWVVQAIAADTGDLTSRYSTVKIDGETIKMNDDGEIFASIEGALTFKGTVDCVFNQYNDSLNAPDYNNAVVGDLYVHADLDASTDPKGDSPHGSWNLGVTTVVIGDLLVKTGTNDWAVIGRVVDDISGFVQKAGDTMTGDLNVEADIRVMKGGILVHELSEGGTATLAGGDILLSSTMATFYSSFVADNDKVTFSHGQTDHVASVDADVINLGFLKDKFGLDPTDPDQVDGFVKIKGDLMTGSLVIGNNITLNPDGSSVFGLGTTFGDNVTITSGNVEATAGYFKASTESGYAADIKVNLPNSWITKGQVDNIIKSVTGITNPESPNFVEGYYVLKSGDSMDGGSTIVLGRDPKDDGTAPLEAVTIGYLQSAISGIVTTLDELDDTNITTPPTEGDTLVYRTNKWVNEPVSSTVSELNDLDDVTISGTDQYEFLMREGADFVNKKPPVVGTATALPDNTGFVQVADEYTDPTTGVKLDTNIKADDSGVIYATIDFPPALEFETIVDATVADPPADAKMGEIYIQESPPKGADGGSGYFLVINSWVGLGGVLVEGGEMYTGADADVNGKPQKWYIIGKVANDTLDSYVRKHGDTMTGNLVVADSTGANTFVKLSNTYGVESKNLKVSENAEIGGNCLHSLTVTALSTFNCEVTIDSTLTVTGDTTLGKVTVSDLVVNGTIGGTLSGDIGNINIDGSGNITIDGVVVIGTDGTCSDTLDVHATTLFHCPTEFKKKLTLSGGLEIDGDLTLTGDLITEGTHTHTGNLVLTGDVSVDGKLNVTGDVALTGDNITVGTGCTDTFTVDAKSEFKCETTFSKNGLVTIDDGSIDVSKNLTVAGNTILDGVTAGNTALGSLTVNGDSQFDGSVVLGDTACNDSEKLEVFYPTTLHCDTTIGGNTTIEGDLTLTGGKVTLPELELGTTVDCTQTGLVVNSKSEFECESLFKGDVKVVSSNVTVVGDSQFLKVVSTDQTTDITTLLPDKIATSGDLEVGGDTKLGIVAGTGSLLVYGPSKFSAASGKRASYVDSSGNPQLLDIDDLLDVELIQKGTVTSHVADEIGKITITTNLVDLDDVKNNVPSTVTPGDTVVAIDATRFEIGEMPVASNTKRGGVRVEGGTTNINIDPATGVISATLPGVMVFRGGITKEELEVAPSANDTKFGTGATTGDVYVYTGAADGSQVDATPEKGGNPASPITGWNNLPTTVSPGDLIGRGDLLWGIVGSSTDVNLDGYVEIGGDEMTGPLVITPAAGDDTTGLTVNGVTTLKTTSITSTLGVTGKATLADELEVTGATTLSSTLGVTGATTLSSTLGVEGRAQFSENTLAFYGTGLDATKLTDLTNLINDAGTEGSVLINRQYLQDELGKIVYPYVKLVGDNMTGNLTLGANPASPLTTIGADGTAAFGGQLDIGLDATDNTGLAYYKLTDPDDADSQQDLTDLIGDDTTPDNVLVTKGYVDALELDAYVLKTGDTMTGALMIGADPSNTEDPKGGTVGIEIDTTYIASTSGAGPVEVLELAGDISTKDDGTYTNEATTNNNAGDNNLTVTYEVLSKTVTSYEIGDNAGDGYDDGDLITVTGDTGVTFTVRKQAAAAIRVLGGNSVLALETDHRIVVGQITGTVLNLSGDAFLNGELQVQGLTALGESIDKGTETVSATAQTQLAYIAGSAFMLRDLAADESNHVDDLLIPSWKHVKEFVLDSVFEGVDIDQSLLHYEFGNTNYVTASDTEFQTRLNLDQFRYQTSDGSKIDLQPGISSTLVNFKAGENVTIEVVNDFNGSEEAFEISAAKSRAAVSSTPPELDTVEEGDLWYNSTDGRLYLAYMNFPPDGSDEYLIWIDASPAAINGGDFLQRKGDTVENYFNVGEQSSDPAVQATYDTEFFAQVYKLESLPSITSI